MNITLIDRPWTHKECGTSVGLLSMEKRAEEGRMMRRGLLPMMVVILMMDAGTYQSTGDGGGRGSNQRVHINLQSCAGNHLSVMGKYTPLRPAS